MSFHRTAPSPDHNAEDTKKDIPASDYTEKHQLVNIMRKNAWEYKPILFKGIHAQHDLIIYSSFWAKLK